MVKKVGGISKSSGAKSTSPVQATKTVESAKVGSVNQVKGSERKEGINTTGASIRALSADKREHIFQMIDEEADKMFSSLGISKKKKEQVVDAVKMAIDAGIVPEEQDN